MQPLIHTDNFYKNLIDQMETARVKNRIRLIDIQEKTGISKSTLHTDRLNPSKIPLYRLREYLRAVGIDSIEIKAEK